MQIIKIQEENYNRIFVISDIHGNAILFDDILSQIKLEKDDLLIIAGDSCDRGVKTSVVYNRIFELIDKGYNLIHLLGNHEDMCLDFLLNKNNEELWMNNGGRSTLHSYDEDIVYKVHIEFMKKMPLIIETDNYIIVHAGIKPGVALEDQEKRDLLWIRDEFINHTFDINKKIIYGHTVNKDGKVHFTEDKISIDCCSYFNFILAAIELKTEKVFYAKEDVKEYYFRKN